MTTSAEPAQTSLLAFLFTDIVGSTDLKRERGDVEGARIIAAHDAAFRSSVARFGGTERDNAGDGFFATFPVPSAALKCALAFQSALAEQQVRARVGIHMGEVVHVPGAAEVEKLLGLAVDTAGRVMSLASGNQILITRHAFDSARQHVLRGPGEEPVLWRAHGAYLFKGLDEPVEIHEAGIEGVAPLAPPQDTEKARRAIAPGDEETLGWRPSVGQVNPGRGDWILQEQLGAGGFGEVWLARSERTKERRAFKFCFQADRLRHLKREMTLFRLLKETLGERDDIARLYDVRFDEAPYFLEMEYTPDGSFDKWAEVDGRLADLALRDRCEFVAEIAEALGAAHSVGVLHKDVKPSNVLVRRDANDHIHARLTDFGIGHLMDPKALAAAQVSAAGFTGTIALTDLGSRTGTRLYMAPELHAGRPSSIGSDVYALGVLLYQVVVGDLNKPLGQGWERDVEDPLLVEDIAACVAGNPKERVASCDLLAERLRSLDARRAERADEAQRVVEEEERTAAEARRARLLRLTTVAAAVLLVLVIAGIVVAGALDSRRREAEDANEKTQQALRREKEALAAKTEALATVKTERDAKAEALADKAAALAAKTEALDRVLRLADAKRVRDLLDEVDRLWPLRPERAGDMAAWIKKATAVLENRRGHEEALASLRKKALPYTEEQRLADHATDIERIEKVRADLAKAEPELEALQQDATEEGNAKREGLEKQVAAMREEIERLAGMVKGQSTWHFDSDQDAWRHQVLSDLNADLARLQAEGDETKGALAAVKERHAFVSTLGARSIDDHRAAWDEVIAAIAASPKYGGLQITPQLGLVPLGLDPDSGLFEFAHMGSGSIPTRDDAGKLVPGDDAAIVLVLIPGGTFLMGAQNKDKDGANYDPQSEDDESDEDWHPVQVALSPYFLSKYECTQAEWKALTGGLDPSSYKAGQVSGDRTLTPRNPVEQVSWEDCVGDPGWLARNRLVLPSEAQWEYACRAGTDTPWISGREVAALGAVANIADKYCKEHGGLPSWPYTEEVDDGHTVHAPVGSFAPNAFGLHDVHGNVVEWCADTYRNYRPEPSTDPLVEGPGSRVRRGGSCFFTATNARSAYRSRYTPTARDHYLGFRPASPVTTP